MPAESSTTRRLFTVGHSNHEFPRFLELLRANHVTAIADVRSTPYSQYTPQFNRETLEAALKAHGVRYAFLGQELGARRSEPNCYVAGKARYDLIARLPAFQRGLDRLRQGSANQAIALMCSEKDPLTCHRTILVCRHLKSPELNIQHILEDGTTESAAQADERLLELLGLPPGDLFRSREQLLELAYDQQGEAIAYVGQPALDPVAP